MECMDEYENMLRIDKVLEPQVDEALEQYEKNFACHGNIFDCYHDKDERPNNL